MSPKIGSSQHQPVHRDLHRLASASTARRSRRRAADRRRRSAYQYSTKKSEIAITISVGAGRSAPKLVNTCLNAGITKIMMTAVMTNATTMHRDRVEQRRLDLALDREDLFLVGRQAVEQRRPGYRPARRRRPGCRTARRSRAGACGTPATGDEPVSTSVLMSISSLAHRGVAVALADDVERLQQRHAGLHHRRELAREERDVLLGDLLAAARDVCFLTLVTRDALAAQAAR